MQVERGPLQVVWQARSRRGGFISADQGQPFECRQRKETRLKEMEGGRREEVRSEEVRSEEVLLREGAMYECYFDYEALRGAEEGCARDSFRRGGENEDMKRRNRGGANRPETKRLLRLQK